MRNLLSFNGKVIDNRNLISSTNSRKNNIINSKLGKIDISKINSPKSTPVRELTEQNGGSTERIHNVNDFYTKI